MTSLKIDEDALPRLDGKVAIVTGEKAKKQAMPAICIVGIFVVTDKQAALRG
jgi:hypothetical protein